MKSDTVWMVFSVLNGFKNFEAAFHNVRDAERYAAAMRGSWHHERHEIYVMEVPIW